jgi:predicted amino acid dehydrogenase
MQLVTITSTTTVNEQRCVFDKIYGEDAYESRVLRRFRDDILSRTPYGLTFIQQYYNWSPLLIETMKSNRSLKDNIKTVTDNLLPFIELQVYQAR